MAEHSMLDSKFPVDVPHFPELLITDAEFVKRLDAVNKRLQERHSKDLRKRNASTAELSSAEPRKGAKNDEAPAVEVDESPFMKALLTSNARERSKETLEPENKTLTDNTDIAFLSTLNPLVDLFYTLSERNVDAEHLDKAWQCDSLATVKMIFNTRSIHLGKSSRPATYRAMGWLYKKHPLTFLVNLPWLVRPIIVKPKPKKDDKTEQKDDKPQVEVKKDEVAEEDDFVLVVPEEGATFDSMAMDRKNGMAHGYWKDLLNLLVLAAHDHLAPDANPTDILNIKQGKVGGRHYKTDPTDRTYKHSFAAINRRSDGNDGIEGINRYPPIAFQETRMTWNTDEARVLREARWKMQHDNVTHKLNAHVVYQLFHVAVARLFAAQLKRDLALLESGDAKQKSRISLAAKWAPSVKEFHDKHTWIASSIAEILFKHEDVCPEHVPKSDRTTYLKYARMNYQLKVLSPLRKELDITERKLTAKDFKHIDYRKVPSLAMNNYTKIFVKKDEKHFNKYLEDVAGGKATISGAVLLPSLMVAQARKVPRRAQDLDIIAQSRVRNLQWQTLVQRIKDSGKIQSSIAVCDVSGSMTWPQRPDGTTPMDAAVGLSLLLAEVCEPPFGGSVITFESHPRVVKIGGASDKRDFGTKVHSMVSQGWAEHTNFERVFSELILPMAKQHNLKQEDMVKQVFVFSDMQWDTAESGPDRWLTSYERIQKRYAAAGYEMPTMIFWDLAAGKSMPVTADLPGTALVNGYSQGQMKMFLDGGSVEQDAAEQDKMDVDGEVVLDAAGNEVKTSKTRQEINSVAVMQKAISHSAYAMLRVVD